MLSSTLNVQRKNYKFREEATSTSGGFHAGPLSWLNWKLECWVLWGEETRRKISGKKARTDNPHMTPGRNRTRAAFSAGKAALSPCFPNTNVWSHLVCNFQAYSHTSSRNVTNIKATPTRPYYLPQLPTLPL